MAKVHLSSTIDIRGINPFILVSRALAAKDLIAGTDPIGWFRPFL